MSTRPNLPVFPQSATNTLCARRVSFALFSCRDRHADVCTFHVGAHEHLPGAGVRQVRQTPGRGALLQCKNTPRPSTLRWHRINYALGTVNCHCWKKKSGRALGLLVVLYLSAEQKLMLSAKSCSVALLLHTSQLCFAFRSTRCRCQGFCCWRPTFTTTCYSSIKAVSPISPLPPPPRVRSGSRVCAAVVASPIKRKPVLPWWEVCVCATAFRDTHYHVDMTHPVCGLHRKSEKN